MNVKKKFKEKKGAAIIVYVLMLVIIFPIITFSIIDLSNIYRISKQLKISLDASVKSSSSRINWDVVPEGDFYINTVQSKKAFSEILSSNLNMELIDKGDYFESIGSKLKCRSFITVYNARHKGSFVSFPEMGTIPSDVCDKPLKVKVDRPTVFAVISTKYKLSPFLGGKTVDIIEYSAAQLNFLDKDEL